MHGLRDLAANKISAYENRTEVKDAVDLFYLRERVQWKQMFSDAMIKRIPIAYEDLRHFEASRLSGLALLLKAISASAFSSFLQELRREVVEEIKKKEMEAHDNLGTIAAALLWDAPPECRVIGSETTPVLRRRAEKLPYPQRAVLLRALDVGEASPRRGRRLA